MWSSFLVQFITLTGNLRKPQTCNRGNPCVASVTYTTLLSRISQSVRVRDQNVWFCVYESQFKYLFTDNIRYYEFVFFVVDVLLL